MDLQLRGKTALVTGSTAGIGFSIAEALAREGAEVIINGRTKTRVDRALEKLRVTPGLQVVGVAADIGNAEGVARVIQEFEDVDILVNNAGIFEAKEFEKITDADWLHIFDVNVMSGVRLSRYYLPRMMQRGWGRIIFISSESALQIPKEMIHYGMTKTGQLAIARGLAEATVGTGVTVNSVLPGPTASEGVGDFVKQMAAGGKTEAEVEREFFANVRPTSLLKRFATPEEVAAMVTFVASPRSSATNGAALRVDGGVVRAIV